MPCQQHFGVLMQCWKDVDFQEGLCSQEAERFQECMTIYQVKLSTILLQHLCFFNPFPNNKF